MAPLDRKWIIWDNQFLLETPQHKDVVKSNLKEIFDLLVDFVWLCRVGILDHNILTALFSLQLDLAAQNLQTAVFGLTSYVSKNWWSDYLVLIFFTVTDWLRDIGLLSNNTSGVDNIAYLIMALYCCFSSNFQQIFINSIYFPDIYFHTLHCT